MGKRIREDKIRSTFAEKPMRTRRGSWDLGRVADHTTNKEMPYQGSLYVIETRDCHFQWWISSEVHDKRFPIQLIYVETLHPDWRSRWSGDFRCPDRRRETVYLQRLIAEIRRIRSRLRLASCTLVCFEKFVESLMTGHGQWTVVDENAKTWVSGPSRSTVIHSPSYAVFHALSAGGSAFLGHY
jgi:hypothetical protein